MAFTTKIQLRLNVKFLNNSRSHLVFSSGQVLTAEPQSSDRDAAGFSNPGGLAVMWGLVVIGLTGLPNSGWAKAHPTHPLAAALSRDPPSLAIASIHHTVEYPWRNTQV